MANHTGQQLGNYRLSRLLGAGGFARMYLGEHIHLGTLAAIKVLDRRLTDEEVERFRNEARTILHLEHPNIVRVLVIGGVVLTCSKTFQPTTQCLASTHSIHASTRKSMRLIPPMSVN